MPDNIKRIAEMAVLLPLANLIAATTLLASYAVGFGSNLGWYFALDDVFAASLIGLAPFYLAVAYWVVIETRLHFNRTRHSADKASKYGPFQRNKLPIFRRWIKVALIFGATLTIIDAFISYWIGRPVDVFAVLMAAGGVLLFSIIDKSISAQWPPQEPPLLVGVALLSIVVLMLISAKGMNDGQRDRFLSYADASSYRAQCGDFVVIRKAGSMYLAIGKDDRHRLIDDDCAQKILIPGVKPKGRLADLPQPVRAIFAPNDAP